MESRQQKRHSFRPLLFAPPGSATGAPRLAPPPPPARKRAESHVRLRSSAPSSPPAARIDWLDAHDLLDDLCEDQLTLSMNLARLERAAEDAPRDPSARAALAALEARVADLLALSRALADLQEIAVDARTHPLFRGDAPLTDYLRGTYAWMHAVVRALDAIATSLHSLTPDWATFRWRIEEAKHFHFDELHGAIRAELEALAVGLGAGRGTLPRSPKVLVGDLASAMGRLFLAAENLEASLDQRFG